MVWRSSHRSHSTPLLGYRPDGLILTVGAVVPSCLASNWFRNINMYLPSFTVQGPGLIDDGPCAVRAVHTQPIHSIDYRPDEVFFTMSITSQEIVGES